MKSIKHIILLLNLILSINLFAQHNEEVTIEGTYRPKVNKVDKILLKPETPQQVFTIPEKEVQVQEIEHRINLDMDKLKPLIYSNKKNAGEEDAKNNFLMAAFGSRISPVFLFRHNSKLTKNWGFGVGLKHYSSWLDIKDYAPSGFMNNGVELGLIHGKPNGVQVDGNVYYKNDTYHYYGVNTTEWAGDSLAWVHAAPRQVYNTVGAHFGVTSTTTRLSEALHDLDVDYHYLFGKVGNGKEHYAKMDYDLAVAKSWWGKKEYPQKMGLMVGAQFAFNEIMEQRGDDRLILKASPYFEIQNAYFRLHLGALMDGATNFETAKAMFRIYPDLRGNLFVLDKKLEFYANLTGGRKILTFRDLIEENPFVSTRLNMEVTTVKMGFEGGIRTNIKNTVDVHVGVRYRQTENDLFYRQYYMSPYDLMGMDRPQNSFDVIYDETQTLSVLSNVRWLVLDELTVDAGFTYNKCDPSREEHAWYRPTTEGNLSLRYQFNPELSFNTSFIYQGGRWAQEASKQTATFQTVKLKDIYDLGLGADYKVGDQMTVFVKADNLLHRKYQLYLDYPVTGIEFFAGLKMAF